MNKYEELLTEEAGRLLGLAITTAIDDKLVRDNKQWAVKSNRASDLGHPCLRYHILNRRHWQEKKLFGVDVLRRFREGNVHEEAALKDLSLAGVKVIETQRGFNWSEYNISGHIDGKVLVDERLAKAAELPDYQDAVLPLEIKSASPYSFAKINSVKDMLSSNYLYMRKYPAQMTLYLLMDQKELGLFLFKDKNAGEYKTIPVELDYELGEVLVKRAETIEQYLKDETPDNEVPCVDYDEMTCGDCPFVHLCLPDIKRDALVIENDPELIDKLNRRAELQLNAKEFATIDKQVKAKLKEIPKAVVGDWFITGKMIQKHIAAKEEQDLSYWQTKIEKLEGGDIK